MDPAGDSSGTTIVTVHVSFDECVIQVEDWRGAGDYAESLNGLFFV